MKNQVIVTIDHGIEGLSNIPDCEAMCSDSKYSRMVKHNFSLGQGRGEKEQHSDDFTPQGEECLSSSDFRTLVQL